MRFFGEDNLAQDSIQMHHINLSNKMKVSYINNAALAIESKRTHLPLPMALSYLDDQTVICIFTLNIQIIQCRAI